MSVGDLRMHNKELINFSLSKTETPIETENEADVHSHMLSDVAF